MAAAPLTYILRLAVALTLVALFALHYQKGGTSIGEYYAERHESQRVKDDILLDYTDSVLFGDNKKVKPEIDLSPTSDAEQSFQQTERIARYDRLILLSLTLLSLLLLIPKIGNIPLITHGYLIIALYLLLISIYHTLNGGAAFSELAVFAHTTRWLCPVAVWLMLRQPASAKSPQRLVIWLLIAATSSTFAAHGIEALNQHPDFTSLILGAADRIGITPSSSTVHHLLEAIGIMDLSLAAALIFFRNKKLLLWMAFWGGTAALARPLAHGIDFWSQALLRTTQCILPLALFLIYKHTITKTQDNRTETT